LGRASNKDLHIAELGKVVFDRIRQAQFTFFNEGQSRHTGNDLREGIDPHDGIALHGFSLLPVSKSGGKEIGYFAFAEQQGTDTRMFPFLHERLDLPVQPFESLNRKLKSGGASIRRRCSSSHVGRLAGLCE
jgi:hypothetical protein